MTRYFNYIRNIVVVFSLCSIGAPHYAHANFVDVTAGNGWTGLPTQDEHPVAVVDVDLDGILDLSVSHGIGITRAIIGLRLYKNDGTGVFSDITAGTGLDLIPAPLGQPTWSDVDNDGDQDLTLRVYSRFGIQVFLNNLVEDGSLTFTPGQLLLGDWNIPSWIDFDQDGDLDLFLESPLTGPLQGTQPEAAMFRNDLIETGSLNFTDVTAAVGLTMPAADIQRSLAWSDADLDGDADLYIASGGGPCGVSRPDRYFRNNLVPSGTATFDEVTAAVGLNDGLSDAGSGTWADYDADGDFDLYVGLGCFTPNRFFHNNLIETGSLLFDERANSFGVDRPIDGGWDIWADFDNDADIDLLAGGVSGDRWFLHKNLLKENGVPGFVDRTAAQGLPLLNTIRTSTLFDMDNDGDLDLLANGGGTEPILLFENDGLVDGQPLGAWLQISLIGTLSNRDGTGALITLRAGEMSQRREAHRYVAFGRQEVRRIHFGLGTADAVQELEIRWPSGCIQTLNDVPANRILSVTEDCGLDHYLVYDAKTTRGTPRFERRTVALADQFDDEGLSRRFAVRAVAALGNPAEKQVDDTVETIVDPDTHLVGYRIRRAGDTPRHDRLSGVKVTNQFGDIVLDTREPDRLLVPSLKDPVEPVPDVDLPDAFALDHFKCYPVSVTRGTAGFAPRDVLLDDQFDATPRLLTVRRPSRLCNPAEKIADGEPVTPIARREDHLLCYTLAAAATQDDDDDDDDLRMRVRGIHVNNQFGPLQLDTRRIEELCVPSTKDLADAVPRDDDDDDDD